MSILNNKYNLSAVDVNDKRLVVEMTKKDNPDRPSHIVEIPTLLFSHKNNEEFLLVVDRIEGSQVVIELSERSNPAARQRTLEFPIDFFEIKPREGMKYTNKIEETYNVSNLEIISQNLHKMLSSSFTISEHDEESDPLREAKERLERLKQSNTTDEIIDL